jgi:TPR repeat protein
MTFTIRRPLFLCFVILTIVLSGCSTYNQVVKENERRQKDTQYRQKLRIACDRGVAWRCTSLGTSYSLEAELTKDYHKYKYTTLSKVYKKALLYYDRGCFFGDPQGCFSGGSLYERHLGTQDLTVITEGRSGLETPTVSTKDPAYVMARKLYKMGCDSKKSSISCGSLTHLYVSGNGGEKDLAQARVYYQLQCPSCSQEKIEEKINEAVRAIEKRKNQKYL